VSEDCEGKQGRLSDLVSYLKSKKAAGLLPLPTDHKAGQEMGLLHIFPPCKFAHDLMLDEAPDLRVDYDYDKCLVMFLVRLKK